jgi:hypothetical protein
MYMAMATAASSAMDMLSSLLSPKTSSTKPTATPTTFDVPQSTGSTPTTGIPTQGGALSPSTFNALLAAQDPSQSSSASTSSSTSSSTSPSASMQDLFSLLDTNGDGSISKSEFESELGAGGTNLANADSVFSQLDSNGVSLDELASALQSQNTAGSHHAHGHHGGHGGGGGGGGGLADALSQSVDGSSSTTTTNSDGSTTTTITYADGSTVTSTSAASKSGGSGSGAGSSGGGTSSNSAASSYNLVEKMIQMQSQAISGAASTSIKV